jgi:23S rRNA pseudouridine2605 synthase
MKERIQKILSQAGLLSRREAERALRQGRIEINGKVILELGVQADPDIDEIVLDGKKINPISEIKTTIIFCKPRSCVTTKSDPENRKTVYDFLPLEFKKLNPVGRLDYDSEGLLLFTNDGELLNHLTHPRYEVLKTYRCLSRIRPLPKILAQLKAGVELSDGIGVFNDVRIAEKNDKGFWLEITVQEGRNRFIRRMFDAVNVSVYRLKRIAMGPIDLGDLRSGQSRPITPNELKLLMKPLSKS